MTIQARPSGSQASLAGTPAMAPWATSPAAGSGHSVWRATISRSTVTATKPASSSTMASGSSRWSDATPTTQRLVGREPEGA